MSLNPLRWFVIRWYKREERELRVTRDPTRAREIARERVATGGPWNVRTAEHWIEDYQRRQAGRSSRLDDPEAQ